MNAGATRRQLITRWIAVGGAAALLTPSLDGDLAMAAPTSDAEVVASTLVVEKLVALAYRQVLASGALADGARRTVAELLAQEHEHAAALAAVLAKLGAPLPGGPSTVAAGEEGLARHGLSTRLSNLQTERECLQLLMDVESVAEGAYFIAISMLRSSSALRLSAEIMACEAQHWSALSELQHPGDVSRAVPYAFVEGSP